MKNIKLILVIVFCVSVILGAPTTIAVSAESPLEISEDFIFTEDLNVPIVVTADNIVIDGNGYTLQGPDIEERTGTNGIYLEDRSNVIIKNLFITQWDSGVVLNNSAIIQISNITIEIGDILYGTLRQGANGIMLFGTSSDNIISNSTFRRAIGTSGVGWRGITLVDTASDNDITENYFFDIISISLHGSSSDNDIYLNTFQTKYQTLKHIDILDDSSGNFIYHNNFIDLKTAPKNTNPRVNKFYHPDLKEGNFWSDYKGLDDGSGTDKHAIAGDGIGDTKLPHPAPQRGVEDEYPFMEENGWDPKSTTTTEATTPTSTVPEFSFNLVLLAAFILIMWKKQRRS